MKRSSKKSSKNALENIYAAVKNAVDRFAYENDGNEEAVFPLRDVLKPLGFRRKSVEGLSGTIFINKEIGIVVKRPYLIERGNDDLPERAIPTKIIHVEDNIAEESDSSGPIYIQPLADVSQKAKDRAHRILCKIFRVQDPEWASEEISDMHDGNVAMWNGKAVRIDW